MNTNQLPEQEPKDNDIVNFIEYVKTSRYKFSVQLLSDNWWLSIGAKRRVMIEDILIAYDQMVQRIESSPNLPEDSAQAGKECYILTGEQIESLKQEVEKLKKENRSDYESGDFDVFNHKNEGRYQGLQYVLSMIAPVTLPAPESKPSPLPEDVENTVNNIIDLFKFHRHFDKPQLDAIRPLLRDELAKSQQTDKRKVADVNEYSQPVHDWFELSYAQYLTIPRSVMEAMPKEWQARIVKCLEELDETIDWRPEVGRYRCELWTTQEVYEEDGGEDEEGEPTGHFVERWFHKLDDPFENYRRPVKMPFKNNLK